jgi:DNA-binding response OmpR family regulator
MGKATILVVDDEQELVNLVSSQLQHSGYDVLTAFGGREGLNKAVNESVDLVILDIIMPVMDGFEVLRQLRNNPKTSQLPIIMLTQRRDTKDVFKAKELWSTDYIMKPFSIKRLTAMVDRYIDMR